MAEVLPIYTFVSGMITMGFVIAGVFFLRFWTRTRDTLFVAFGVAFWLLASSQALLALSRLGNEDQSPVFMLRLAAFLLIIAAILGKNLPPRR